MTKLYFILFGSYLGMLILAVLVETIMLKQNFSLVQLANWDGGHFLNIAEHGYSSNIQYAFLPLYPLGIKLLNFLTHSYLISGILISLLSLTIGLIFLVKLLQLDYKDWQVKRIIISLILFPTSFFLITAYSESLFLCFSVASFFFLRKNKFILATMLALLSSLTRPEGVLVIVALWIESWRSKNKWVTFIAPLGLIGFVLFIHLFYKQTPISAEVYWGRNITFYLTGIWNKLIDILLQPNLERKLIFVFDIVAFVLGLGLSIRSFKSLRPSYAFYALGSSLLPVLTNSLTSTPRFLLVVFPVFILIGLAKRCWFMSYLLISLPLLIIFAALFLTGFWVS